MDVSAFTDEHPAYLYSIYLKPAKPENIEIKIAPICGFRQLLSSAYSDRYQVRLVPSASLVHKSAYYRIPKEPCEAMANGNHSIFYCWSPDSDSYEAKMNVLKAALAWYDKRIFACRKQLVSTEERRDQVESLIFEERMRHDG